MKYYSVLILIIGLITGSTMVSMEKSLSSVKDLQEKYMKGTSVNNLVGSFHLISLKEKLESVDPDAGRWLIEHGAYIPYIEGNNELKAILKELYPSALMQAIVLDCSEREAVKILNSMIELNEEEKVQRSQELQQAFLLAIGQRRNTIAQLLYSEFLLSLPLEILHQGIIRAAEANNVDMFNLLSNRAGDYILSQALEIAVIQRMPDIAHAILICEITYDSRINLQPALASLNTILASLKLEDRATRDTYIQFLENLGISQLGRVDTFAEEHSLAHVQRLIQQVREIQAEPAVYILSNKGH